MPKGDMTAEQFRESGLQMRGSSRSRVDYKADLLKQIADADLPAPQAEYQFNERRKWRFDWAYPDERVGIEYEGGIFDSGETGHRSVSGVLRDVEKYNEAALAGFVVIRVTPQSVTSGMALRYIKRALSRAKGGKIADGRVDEVRRTLTGLLNRLDSD